MCRQPRRENLCVGTDMIGARSMKPPNPTKTKNELPLCEMTVSWFRWLSSNDPHRNLQSEWLPVLKWLGQTEYDVVCPQELKT